MGMSHVTQSDPITMWHAPTDDRCLFNEEWTVINIMLLHQYFLLYFNRAVSYKSFFYRESFILFIGLFLVHTYQACVNLFSGRWKPNIGTRVHP
jgi:hypothetical protein